LPYHLATAPPDPEGINLQALALALLSVRANCEFREERKGSR
jgi:hypothetical protein